MIQDGGPENCTTKSVMWGVTRFQIRLEPMRMDHVVYKGRDGAEFRVNVLRWQTSKRFLRSR